MITPFISIYVVFDVPENLQGTVDIELSYEGCKDYPSIEPRNFKHMVYSKIGLPDPQGMRRNKEDDRRGHQ